MSATAREIAEQLAKRITEKAMTEADPIGYFSRAIARVNFLEQRAKVHRTDMETELLRFGLEFGLISEGTEN